MSGHWGIKRKDHDQVYNYGGMTRKIGGVVKAFETNDTFTYIASDATICYGKKCKEAVRQFVFLYPDYIIVYDRVTSSDPSYRKEWLLHTQNKPEMKGNGDTRLKKPVKAQYIHDGEKDGVQLKVDGRKITFWFNRAGSIGGEVEYDGEKRPLTEKVQPQSGFEF